MIALSLILLALSIACYSVGELQKQNKLRWQDEEKDYFSFWGKNSWVRKYAGNHKNAAILQNIKQPNWYYRFFKLKYKERWPTSATFTVMFTDGMHLAQFCHHALLSISFGLQFQINWFNFNGHVQAMVATWIVVKLSHGFCYKIFQR